MKTINLKLYKFDELSAEAQQKALDALIREAKKRKIPKNLYDI